MTGTTTSALGARKRLKLNNIKYTASSALTGSLAISSITSCRSRWGSWSGVVLNSFIAMRAN